MKGFALWTTILVIFTVIIVMTLLLPSLITSGSKVVEASAALNAEEISGIINLLQTAPAGTVHQYSLPKAECEINIGHNSVTVSLTSRRKETYTLGYIQNIDVAEGTENCDPKKEKIIYFVRCEKSVVMSQSSAC